MAIEWVGGTVSLTANGTGSITLEYPRDGEIVQILVNSTDRCKITKIEQEGVDVYTTGVLELDQLKMRGNIYELPEPIAYRANARLVFSLEDISGAANVVYIAVCIRYG
jgi:hypothetical protein